MNKEIKFSLYPVSGAARERGGYRARLIKERGEHVMDFDAVVAEAIAQRRIPGANAENVKFIVRAVLDSMIEGVSSDGMTRRIDDYLSVSMNLYGHFNDESEPFDPERHKLGLTLTQLRKFRPDLSGSKVVNVKKKAEFRVYSIHSADCDAGNRIIVPGHDIIIKGSDLKLNLSADFLSLHVRMGLHSFGDVGDPEIISMSDNEIRCKCPEELTKNAKKYNHMDFELSVNKFTDPSDWLSRIRRSITGRIALIER